MRQTSCEVRLIFDLLDVDHSGKIDADEMKRAAQP